MGYITVDVEVDIDEFDLDDILEGVETKWDSHRPKIQKSNRKQITEFFSDLIDESIETPISLRSTVIDEVKMSIVTNGLANKSIEELQEFFK